MENTKGMCKEDKCISQFMLQPQQTTWNTFRAPKNLKAKSPCKHLGREFNKQSMLWMTHPLDIFPASDNL